MIGNIHVILNLFQDLKENYMSSTFWLDPKGTKKSRLRILNATLIVRLAYFDGPLSFVVVSARCTGTKYAVSPTVLRSEF